jgi:UDP-glucose 4-epimerase
MKSRILITGSTGYIGRNLLRYWLEHGKGDVVRVDRSTGFELAVSGWTRHLHEREVDVVVHLAQSRRYREFPAGAQDMFRVNVASTLELLEWAREHGVRRFIFASTGTVYASSTKKVTETAECEPASMYAATKLSAEHLIRPYGAFFEIVIARLFAVYGPRQRQTLIADMTERIRTGKEISLAAGVGMSLTPLFIEDCVKVFSCLEMAPLANTITILNVAGDEVIGLDGVVAQIASQLHKQPMIRVTDDKPKYLCADNTRLKAYYRDSFVPFSTGLELTLRNNRELT